VGREVSVTPRPCLTPGNGTRYLLDRDCVGLTINAGPETEARRKIIGFFLQALA